MAGLILKRIFFGLIFISFITGCTVNGNSYTKNKPEFVFEEFFSGPLCAWGTVKKDNGELLRKFIAKINAYEENGFTVLDEVFMFNDGEKQLRLWKFSQQNDQLNGTAGDVVGNATGKSYGDSLHLEYVLAINSDGSEWHINMDDWLHLIDQNTLMGTTQMSKFGFDLGRIDIVIRKQQTSVSECENFDQIYASAAI